MQKIRTYLKESVIDYQDRLDNKNSKTKKKILSIHRLSPDQVLYQEH